MLQEQKLHEDIMQNVHINSSVTKGKLDLLVLRNMVQKVHIALQKHCVTALHEPIIHTTETLSGRLQRIVLYNVQDLQPERRLKFVGFVSKKRQILTPATLTAINKVDQQLVADLVQVPHLLCYSSLELRPGYWYNVVLFTDSSAKEHIQSSATHRHAAYQLSRDYYEWIRLHNGSIPGGLIKSDLHIHTTKYYTFPGSSLAPAVHETIHPVPITLLQRQHTKIPLGILLDRITSDILPTSSSDGLDGDQDVQYYVTPA